MIGCKDIDYYITEVKKGHIITNQWVKKLCDQVEQAFKTEDIYVDIKQWEAYKRIGFLMYKDIYEWELFITPLCLCTYTRDYQPRWSKGLILMGRGNGKDGMIAWWSVCLTSKYNPISRYDVDICANNEEQSTRPVKDIIDWLETPSMYEKNKTSYHWTLESIRGLTNKGRIKGHTNSPKGKDGLRTGIVILNEVHQYQDYANINIFMSGLGKVEHPRMFMFTTNGEVRQGVLDTYLDQGYRVLNGEETDGGFLFYLCSLDSKEEVHEETNWYKANPSLMYKPALLDEIRSEYKVWASSPNTYTAFMTKRMNMPEMAKDKEVVVYEYIKATNKPLIDLFRKNCIVGVDLSRTTDMCSVSFLFKEGTKRYVINHSWICTHSNDWERIKVKDQFPTWVNMGLLTIVDDIEINPQLITDYIQEHKKYYNILKVAIDDFRCSIFSYDLAKIGFTRENKNLKLVRPSDIAKAVPIIESAFINENFFWGDNPVLRWATNNTKLTPFRTKNTDNSDLGNLVYAKIEGKSRKTDPFMSLVAAMTCDSDIPEQVKIDPNLLRAVSI